MRTSRRFLFPITLVISLCIALPALGGPTIQSKHRKLLGEEGNCIFSGGQLLFDKEDAYTDLRTEWTAPEAPTEGRCWFPDSIETMSKRGPLGNSMVVDGQYLVFVKLIGHERGAENNAFKKNIWQDVTDNNKVWETQRMILDPTDSRCFVKGFGSKDTSDAGCLDWDKMGRRMAESAGESLPYSYTTCLTFQYNWAERTEEVWDEQRGAVVQTAVVETHAFASGCFEYTVK
jgi:hypothetical protein